MTKIINKKEVKKNPQKKDVNKFENLRVGSVLEIAESGKHETFFKGVVHGLELEKPKNIPKKVEIKITYSRDDIRFLGQIAELEKVKSKSDKIIFKINRIFNRPKGKYIITKIAA